MENEAEKIDNQKGNGVLPCVSGSKLERIAQTKKLFEEGLVFFNKNKSYEYDKYIIKFDRGSVKDYYSMSEVKVKYNSFVDAIKEIDQNAHQPWIDERLWLINCENDYPLKVVVYDNKATVCPNGYGGCQPLIANTPEELKECCKMWSRNR